MSSIAKTNGWLSQAVSLVHIPPPMDFSSAVKVCLSSSASVTGKSEPGISRRWWEMFLSCEGAENLRGHSFCKWRVWEYHGEKKLEKCGSGDPLWDSFFILVMFNNAQRLYWKTCYCESLEKHSRKDASEPVHTLGSVLGKTAFLTPGLGLALNSPCEKEKKGLYMQQYKKK